MPRRSRAHALYTMEVSYFSAKARTYFRLKGIPVEERPINLFQLFVTSALNDEDRAMPAVRTTEGQWMQDTKAIIDHFERLYPQPQVIPSSPIQRIAAYLFELWADEAWVPVALHTRWNDPENYPRFEACLGPGLLPWAPPFIQRAIARIPAAAMRIACPIMGITKAQIPILEHWADHRLDLLNDHFATWPYVLGGRPSIADVALHGPMYAHLRTDPWPRKHLIEPRPHLMAWIDRLTNMVPGDVQGEYLPDDVLPETLTPIFEAMGRTHVPFFIDTIDTVKQRRRNNKGKLSRGVRNVSVPMEQGAYQRAGFTIHLWMVQRIQDVYRAMGSAEHAVVDPWLAQVGADKLLTIDIPRVERAGLSAAWA